MVGNNINPNLSNNPLSGLRAQSAGAGKDSVTTNHKFELGADGKLILNSANISNSTKPSNALLPSAPSTNKNKLDDSPLGLSPSDLAGVFGVDNSDSDKILFSKAAEAYGKAVSLNN